MANFTVVYDACVLYPAPLRDLLMRLALTDLFRARWTEDIHEEWIRNVLVNRPDLTREQLDRTRTLMNENVRDCVVEGYRDLIDSLELPDPDDRHVLAAAIRAHADAIVTFNLEDFPAARLAEFGIEAQHPDEFIEHLIDLNQAKVCAAVEDHLHSLRNPPKTRDQYLDTLLRQGLPQTANLCAFIVLLHRLGAATERCLRSTEVGFYAVEQLVVYSLPDAPGVRTPARLRFYRTRH